MTATNQMFRLKDDEGLERGVRRILRHNIGERVYPDRDLSTLSRGSHSIPLAASHPSGVINPMTGQRQLNWLKYSDIGSLEVSYEDGTWTVTAPDRQRLQRNLTEQRESLRKRAEKAVIAASGFKIVHVPKVMNALNPIKEILEVIDTDERVPMRNLPAKAPEYLDLLTELDVVIKDQDGLITGGRAYGETYREAVDQDEDPIYSVLHYVLIHGYHHLRADRSIMQPDPIIRLVNSYYWPSAQAGEPLKLTTEDVTHYYGRIYSTPPARPKVISGLRDLSRAGVLRMSNDRFHGSEETLADYSKQVPTIAQERLVHG